MKDYEKQALEDIRSGKKTQWEVFQEVLARRYEERKANHYIDEIVYQSEDYFEQIKALSSINKIHTPIFLIECVDANQKLDGWRVEYTTIEARPQDTSRWFRSELDARMFFEMMERGQYASALEFAHRLLLEYMGVKQEQEQAEPTEEERAAAEEMEAAAYEAERQSDAILAQQELEDFEAAGAGVLYNASDDFDPFADEE